MEQKQIFSTKEAARYLEMDFSLFRYHLYEMKHLEPDYRVGNNLGFSKETLDQFKAKYRSEGFTVTQAALYLGVKVSWIRHHMFNTRLLVADAKRGRKAIFFKKTLEAARVALLSKPEESSQPQPEVN